MKQLQERSNVGERSFMVKIINIELSIVVSVVDIDLESLSGEIWATTSLA